VGESQPRVTGLRGSGAERLHNSATVPARRWLRPLHNLLVVA